MLPPPPNEHQYTILKNRFPIMQILLETIFNIFAKNTILKITVSKNKIYKKL